MDRIKSSTSDKMMSTQAYYSDEFDSVARSNFRAPTAAYYDRQVPYGYFEAPDYPGRAGSRTLIQDPGNDSQAHAHARRRIQVACSRCRRRKIKCTGDPGDGSGCSACRSAGADRSTCTFIRVGSYQTPIAAIDLPGSATTVTPTPTTTYSVDATTATYDSGLYQTHHRPSLPMLQTRGVHLDYDHYNTSPADDYTYASSTTALPRQQSFASTYSAESFRPWTSGSISTPVSAASVCYEPGSAFSFGSLHIPPMPPSRLPSVSSEAFSPLNMSSLRSSLPTQTVQERRLPMPYSHPYSQHHYTAVEVPQIRPLGSFDAHGVHGRDSLRWSIGQGPIPSSSRNSSMNGLPPMPQHHNLPPRAPSTSVTDSTILGYQFSTASSSPDISPTSGPTTSDSYSATAPSDAGSGMPPPRNTAASLYSFSAGVDTTDHGSTSDRRSTIDENVLAATPQHHYVPSLRHPQPQHTASLDELRRRSSNDGRIVPTHRTSASNLNGRY